ncbi:MAG: peptidoglycan-binding domain-containing protein [Solirubrobacterales bacterium]
MMQALRKKHSSRPRVLLAGVAAAAVLAFPASGSPAHASPLDGNGMWIWYVSASGGSAEAIAKKANRRNIDVVMIKSADAGNYWGQFSPQLVKVLHEAGLQVCAWQFVYGSGPRTEARRGAEAVENGADCLLIDAEGHYEGRYKAADRYIDELRDRVGPDFPVALASFPYVDYHPSFPYSVFLGKGAAQFNVPQMYWKTIGTSVRRIYAHTYEVNAPYERPIFPLGQTYLNVSRKSIIRFRKYARRYDAGGVSWWSWQETRGKEWRWVGKPLKGGSQMSRAARARERSGYPALEAGDAGDLVVWAQQHLAAHGHAVEIDGTYSGGTIAAVRGFQSAKALTPSGEIDDATWRALLKREPEPVDWSRVGSPPGARAGGVRQIPDSASLDALRFELPLTPGRP